MRVVVGKLVGTIVKRKGIVEIFLVIFFMCGFILFFFNVRTLFRIEIRGVGRG